MKVSDSTLQSRITSKHPWKDLSARMLTSFQEALYKQKTKDLTSMLANIYHCEVHSTHSCLQLLLGCPLQGFRVAM